MTDIETPLVVRMEASLRKFERQMDAARRKGVGTATDLERRFERSNQRISKSANTAARSMSSMTNVSRQGRFVLQNTAAQISDVAVQLEMGTSAFRVVGQQLPQITGGFAAFSGSIGTVIPVLGVAIGLLAPLVGIWAANGEQAQTLADSLKDLNSAFSDLQQAQNAASAPLSNLTDKYGKYYEQARQVLEIQREMAVVNAQEKLTAVVGSLGDTSLKSVLGFTPEQLNDAQFNLEALKAELEGFQAIIDGNVKQGNFGILDDLQKQFLELRAAVLNASEARQGLDRIAQQFNITTDAAFDLANALVAVRESEGTEGQAAALEQFKAALVDATDGVQGMDDKMRALLESVLQAHLAALELSSVDLASAFANAADQADRLKGSLIEALNVQNALAAGYAYGNEGSGGRGRGPTRAELFEMRNGFVPVPERVSRPSGGGGGGGGGGGASAAQKAHNELMREAERLYTATRTELEKYTIEREKLDALNEAGVLQEGVYQRALDKLQETYTDVGKAAKESAGAAADAFDQLFDGIGEGAEQAAQALEQLGRSLFKSGAYDWLAGQFPNVFGPEGFVPLKNAKGNAFANGRVTPFANGGVVNSATHFPMRGGVGLMGEAGPEAILPLTRMQGGKLGVAARGGGSAGTTFQIIDQRRGGRDIETQRVQGPDGSEMIVAVVADAEGRGTFDKTRAQRTGGGLPKPRRFG